MENKQWDKIAEDYHNEVVSPFYGGVENPLFNELKNIKNKKKKSVAEFGCGLFYLGKFLSKEFKEVYASDFSQKMVTLARERNKCFNNVCVNIEDIRKLKHKKRFDVIIAVNSLIMPSFECIKGCFSNIYSSLKPKGDVFLILPSMEGVLYHGMLLFQRELNKKKESKAIRSAKIKFENKKYDLFLGHYVDGKDKQKFYYQHEILYFMNKAGFKDVQIKKVKYPWKKGMSDYESFPKEEKIWDWFVKARK